MHGRALKHATHELVRVPRDRVGALHAGQLVAQLVRQQAAATPGGVDVQPHVVLGAQVRNRLDRVEGAQHGGAAGAVHIEGPVAGLDARQDQALEFVGPHAAALVAGHLDHVVDAEAAGGAGALTRVVALWAAEMGRLVSFEFGSTLGAPSFAARSPILTCSEVNRTSCWGSARIPLALYSGNILWRATMSEYKFEMAPPGARIESPLVKPIMWRIFSSTKCSIRMKTGAIS